MRFLGFDREFYKDLILLSLPAILQFFLFHLLNLSDNWMVASLGSLSLAGVALSNKITLIMGVFSFGLSNGVSVYTAQVFSIKDYTAIHKAYAYLIIRILFASFLFFIPSFLFAPEILSLLTNDPEIIRIGSIYLPFVSLSFIPMSLGLAVSWVMRSFQEARIPLYATIIAVVLNLILNYIFMFMLNMGVLGAALGTTISRTVEFLFLIFFTQLKKLRRLLGFKAFWEGLKSRSFAYNKKLSKLAMPIAFNELLWAVSIAFLEIIYVGINRNHYASYVIASGAAEFSYFVFHALAISCGILLGNRAKGGKKVLSDMGFGFIKLGSIFSLVNMCLVFILSFIIPLFFNHLEDPQLIGSFLRTIAFFTIFNLLSLMMNLAILRAGGDSLFALITDSVPQWFLTIPMAFIAAHYFSASVRAVYILVALVEFGKFIIFYFRVRSKKWIKDVINLNS